jgi:hypothetical protein
MAYLSCQKTARFAAGAVPSLIDAVWWRGRPKSPMLIVQLENSHVMEVGHGPQRTRYWKKSSWRGINQMPVNTMPSQRQECVVRRGFEEAVLFGGYPVEQGSNRVGDWS